MHHTQQRLHFCLWLQKTINQCHLLNVKINNLVCNLTSLHYHEGPYKLYPQ